ncbi:MAG: RsmG family class I SAM-dependent methyltransferase [Candidatus Actinomarina sp.]|nr:class I SAM-dependent methyltransferase [Actinomycetota bacterium]
MNFEPQLPNWGYELAQKKLDILIKYHSWLKETGIKTGLISQKNDQFIWDEFIVHSLYFSIIFQELEIKNKTIFDLGTGGGIPGIPLAITSNNLISLIDIKESRINELIRLKNILNLDNIKPTLEDANKTIVKEGLFVSRCYISTENALNLLKNKENSTYVVSSADKETEYDSEKFHVKHLNFYINKEDLRHIDVITVK